MNPYDVLTDYDIKHIKEIHSNTNELLAYVNDLVLLHHNLDYDKGYDEGFKAGLSSGYGVHPIMNIK